MTHSEFRSVGLIRKGGPDLDGYVAFLRADKVVVREIEGAIPEADLRDLSVLLLDGAPMTPEVLARETAALAATGIPVLVLFRLVAGTAYRVQREALLSAGAADVIQQGAPAEDFVTRVRALCLINEAPRILVVDDDESIARWVAEELTGAGMRVVAVHNLAAAYAAFGAGPLDALIVDRQLPDGDGLSFVARLRAERISTPALIYTAMTDIADRVDGLERAGANDYLCKPAHADELCARVKVLLRPRLTEDQLIFGPLALSRRDRVIRWRAERVEMRPRETDVLIYLAERSGLWIPQQMLYLDIWEKIFMEIGSNPVAATKHRLVVNLRKFVQARGESLPDFIASGGNTYAFLPEPLLQLSHDGNVSG
ncbi:MAG: response regulator transcription factor [Rhodobacteraceae bacterium]|nr:response regulator transcription factor [Paracoccaceae bacterium]MCP5341754.1 response regulator transcription factor [Paracoccaceae bacterium]